MDSGVKLQFWWKNITKNAYRIVYKFCRIITYLGGGKFRGTILQKTAYTHLEEVEEVGNEQMLLRVFCKRQSRKGTPLSIVQKSGRSKG